MSDKPYNPFDPNQRRWSATVTFKTEIGPVDTEYYFNEWHEFGEMIEQGADWYAIDKIEVRLMTDFRSPIPSVGWKS